jgi:SPASM domain peptide maturase of grasp-with-spasm system
MLYSNCIPVKGYSRCIIYDIQTNRFRFISNSLFDLFFSNKGRINQENYMDYKDFLIQLNDADFGTYILEEFSLLFPALNLYWDTYSKVSNSVIDIANDLDHKGFNILLKSYELLICKDVYIRFLQEQSSSELSNFFSIFSNTNINSIVVFIPFQAEMDYTNYNSLFEKQVRLQNIIIYKSPNSDLGSDSEIRFIKTNIFEESNRVSKDNFIANIPLFTESQLHNTYFNRKLSIDAEGSIKNSPELPWHYGNVSDTKLEEAIKDEGTDTDFFKKYALYLKAQNEGKEYALDFEKTRPAFNALYFIHKEMIDVCKECEFRHMCVDACVPVQRADNTWYRSQECNYNPYICKWEGEEGYQKLAETGVVCNNDGFSINHEKVAAINEVLWAE